MREALRAVIVDDEALARERVRTFLQECNDIEIAAECTNGAEAIDAVRRTRPSLLFLDVQMPEVDGFGVLETLAPEERPLGIIFATAYDRYAIRAFDVNAIDYLLKPYTRERFHHAISRARERLAEPAKSNEAIDSLLRTIAGRSTPVTRLAIRDREGVQFVRVPDIDWIEADANYSVLHTVESAMRIREPISELEERLRPAGFIRIHRSFMVNADRIFRLEPWANGEYVVVLRNGTKLNSGRAYAEQLRALIE